MIDYPSSDGYLLLANIEPAQNDTCTIDIYSRGVGMDDRQRY